MGFALEQVEPRHWLRERFHAEQRAARNIAAVREYTGYEWIESVDRRQQTRAGEESPLEQITTRDAAPRQLANDFSPVVTRTLRRPVLDPGCRQRLIDGRHGGVPPS